MKQILLIATILCAFMGLKAQLPVDSIHKTWNSVTAFTSPDSGEYVQFNLLPQTGNTVLQQSAWIQNVDSVESYSFGNLDTMTSYRIRVDKFPNIAGIEFPFTTDTLITAPTIVFDSVQLFISSHAVRYYFHGGNGYDTAFVELLVNTSSNFNGLQMPNSYLHLAWGTGSGSILVSNIPWNTTFYAKARKKNSSGWSSYTATTSFILVDTVTTVIPTPLVDTAYTNSFVSANFNYSTNVADESWLIVGIDSAQVANGIGTIHNQVTGLGGAPYSNIVTVSGFTQNDRIYAVHVVKVGLATYISAVKGVSTLSTTPALNSLVFVDTDTSSINLLWLINTNGYSGTILKKIGYPVLASNTVMTSVSSGPLNPSLAISFTGLQSGTQYQEQIGVVLYGDTFWSNQLTNQTVTVQQVTVGPLDMYMDPSVYQESDDSIAVGVYFKSENGPGTIWSETATDSNFLNVAFSSGAVDVQSPGAGVYGYVSYTYFHFDDLVLDQTYYTRGVGFNASTGITHTDDYIAFGVYSTGINVTVDGEGNVSYNNIRVKYVAPNKEIKLFLKIYSVEGRLVDQQSIDESQTTVVPKSGIYILTVCDKNGKIYGKRKCAF